MTSSSYLFYPTHRLKHKDFYLLSDLIKETNCGSQETKSLKGFDFLNVLSLLFSAEAESELQAVKVTSDVLMMQWNIQTISLFNLWLEQFKSLRKVKLRANSDRWPQTLKHSLFLQVSPQRTDGTFSSSSRPGAHLWKFFFSCTMPWPSSRQGPWAAGPPARGAS